MLDTASLGQAQRALHLTAQLLRVHDAFEQAHIPYITFKGPTLSVALYGDVGTRRYGDVDIIVSASRVLDARRALSELGFHPYLQVANNQLIWLTSFLNEYAMLDDRSMVEIHWSVVRPGYRFSMTYEDLAPHQTTTMTIAGRAIPVLCNEALVVVLAVHGAKHGWVRHSWLTDFADLAFGPEPINWEHVFEIAKPWGASRFLLQAGWLARSELGSTLPPILEKRIDADPIARTAARIAKRARERGKQSYLSYVTAMSDTRSRIRAFEEIFIDPTPLDCQLIDLPKPLFPLYHAVRPIRLIGKHVFKLKHRPWST